jgi:hypothetical protein
VAVTVAVARAVVVGGNSDGGGGNTTSTKKGTTETAKPLLPLSPLPLLSPSPRLMPSLLSSDGSYSRGCGNDGSSSDSSHGGSFAG